MMTNSDIVLQNSNGSPNLGAGSPNRDARSQDGDAGSQDGDAGSQDGGAGCQDGDAGSQDGDAGSQDGGVGSGILRDPAEFNPRSCSNKILTKMSRTWIVIQLSDKIKRRDSPHTPVVKL